MENAGPYFEGDHPGLKRRLEEHFSRISESFAERGFSGALILGGGYGRGEGGVMEDPGGVGFSNDLDYFLFNENPADAALLAWCREIERSETEILGIDVEIKTLRAGSIGDPSLSMMFADLVAGHVAVAGDADFLRTMSETLDFSRIKPEEATRLLWNRGSGMFFSRCRMGEGGDKKFVIRNHAKLKLALGDAWLCLHGNYTSKCRKRGERLAAAELPANLSHIKEWHREGVDFKFNPFAEGPTWAELEAESKKLIEAWGLVYLAAENERLKKRFAGFSDYLAAPRLLPGSPASRNFALAIRDRLKRGGCLKPLGDYPRAGLMRALPCLLGLTTGGEAEAGRFLPKPAGDLSRIRTWEPEYSKWWTFYA